MLRLSVPVAPGVFFESETKCSSWAFVGPRDELTSVSHNNRAADRKTQAHAVSLRGVERLKDRRQFLFFDANSVIFYYVAAGQALDPNASRVMTSYNG